MAQCPKCGIGLEEGVKFCRNCGMPARAADEEAGTLPLPPERQSNPEISRPTLPVSPTTTAPTQHGGPSYVPPMNYYPAPRPPEVYAPPPVAGIHTKIRLGDWLSGGWQVYKENWLLMSLATLLGSILGTVTIGILAGPLLMGLFRMALKTMRGEQPEMGDLFNWQGRFLHAFLLALICSLVYGGVASIGHNSVGALLGLAATPLLTMILALGMPFILERKVDVLAAINEVGRLIFSRDTLMWWIVGLVISGITTVGFFGCGVGVFLTLPWIVCSAAVAYRDIYGIDDPNRTLH